MKNNNISLSLTNLQNDISLNKPVERSNKEKNKNNTINLLKNILTSN